MNAPELFDVIYADPPWRYDNRTPGREIENHYPTMSLDELKSLTIPATKDAALFMWATVPLLPNALDLMQHWGFPYRSSAVWDKEVAGMGYWFRGQHEHLLVGVRGSFSPPAPSVRVPSVYREPRGRHSRKPEHIRRLIATWYPDARRLEMFCRYPSPGWSVWGNQVDSSLALAEPERFDPQSARHPGQCDLFGGAA